jgi:hypothetical protein
VDHNRCHDHHDDHGPRATDHVHGLESALLPRLEHCHTSLIKATLTMEPADRTSTAGAGRGVQCASTPASTTTTLRTRSCSRAKMAPRLTQLPGIA